MSRLPKGPWEASHLPRNPCSVFKAVVCKGMPLTFCLVQKYGAGHKNRHADKQWSEIQMRQLVNRAALMVTPKEPFIKWVQEQEEK